MQHEVIKKEQIFIGIDSTTMERMAAGKQTMLFQKDIPLSMINYNLIGQAQKVPVYLFVTKDKNQNQIIIIAKALVDQVYSPMYAEEYEKGNKIEYAMERNRLVKALYIEYCVRKGQIPNMNEGWFKSREFQNYLYEIEFDSKEREIPSSFNYALHISDYQKLPETMDVMIRTFHASK